MTLAGAAGSIHPPARLRGVVVEPPAATQALYSESGHPALPSMNEPWRHPPDDPETGDYDSQPIARDAAAKSITDAVRNNDLCLVSNC
jgi:hypothetical protein